MSGKLECSADKNDEVRFMNDMDSFIVIIS
jgi:hypothetical protein